MYFPVKIEFPCRQRLFLFPQTQSVKCLGGTAAFERKNGPSESQHLRTIAALREKLQRKNEVVAELMEEHLQLKKELGEL
jgi:hypothetical protein